MGFCVNCGAKLEDENQAFCQNCGAPIEKRESQPTGAAAYQQSYSQQPAQAQDYAQPQYAAPEAQPVQHKMKWYKFLIYFALFIGALGNIASGIMYITGDIYATQSEDVTADMVYSVFGDGLKTVDLAMGALLIAIAAFGIYTRFRLAKYKADAPKCLYILYAANGGIQAVYGLIVASIIGQSQTSSVIGSIVGAAIMIWLNKIYFDKRKDLFVN